MKYAVMGILVLGLGCTADGGDSETHSAATETSGGTGTTTGPGMTTLPSTTVDTTGSVTASTTSDASSSSTSDEPVFDFPPTPDVPGKKEGCEAIDFLFVIDDSSSMVEHQENLVANFPTFIDGIQATLTQVETFQVGVIATDPFSGNPGQCILLGALITSTEGAGDDSSNMVCGPYADGANYMTEADDLDMTFSCAAQVGTMGNGFERPMEAIVEVMDGSLGGAGGCNEGFLRDEALLVVVVITDEYDGEGDPEDVGGLREPATSTGTPQTWYDAVIAAKGGIEENASALGILNYEGGACPPADLGHDGVNIVEWVEHFGPRGHLGGICEKDYAPFFEDSIEVIAEACANFIPAG